MQNGQIPVSLSTQQLLKCLAKWRRKTIAALLFDHADPMSYLVSGNLYENLASARPDSQTQPRLPCRFEVNTSAVIGFFDLGYPQSLREIPDPPLVLFFLGELAALDHWSVSVVGARRCTSSGRQHAYKLGRDLAQSGVTEVSGLALGIDAAAHEGSLSASGGVPTVAVLGSGLNRLYPKQHLGLSRQILGAGGLLLSEYPDDCPPARYFFPERNRLISGLSSAVVVVEAGRRSGSLITARFALEQGRDVFALPGPIQNETSMGCHDLIKQGAGLLTHVNDVFQEIDINAQARGSTTTESAHRLDDIALAVLAQVTGYAVTFDELLIKTGIDAQVLVQNLVALEVLGFVERRTVGYIRVPS